MFSRWARFSPGQRTGSHWNAIGAERGINAHSMRQREFYQLLHISLIFSDLLISLIFFKNKRNQVVLKEREAQTGFQFCSKIQVSELKMSIQNSLHRMILELERSRKEFGFSETLGSTGNGGSS